MLGIKNSLILEYFLDKSVFNKINKKKANAFVSLVISNMGIIGAVYQMLPPPDRHHGIGWRMEIDILEIFRTLATIWKSYIPIHQLSTLNVTLLGFLSLVLISLSLLLIIRSRQSFLLYVFGTSLILLFTYSKYYGYLRHHGHLFILLIACLWISNNDKHLNSPKKTSKILSLYYRKFGKYTITVLLCLHLISGISYFKTDLLGVFSDSKEASQFIKDNRMENLLIVGYKNSQVASLSALLDKDIYYLQNGEFGSFIVWKKKNKKEMSSIEIINEVANLRRRSTNDILLVTTYKIELSTIKSIPNDISISEVSEFNKSLSENYYLYLVEQKKRVSPNNPTFVPKY